MTARASAVAERPLPAVAVEVLESVHQHRLLSLAQIHALHTPRASLRWTQWLVGELYAHGLVRFVRGAGAAKLWYVSARGADAVEALPTRAETRRKVVAPAQAAGPLRQHTLAVNDAGIAFVEAARERGEECGPFSWRHEMAHPIGRRPGRARGELLIADALLAYLQPRADGEATVLYRFLELDRATLPADALAEKLTRYARLYQYVPDRAARKSEPAWRAHYPAFPPVHVLLAGASPAALARRIERVVAIAQDDPELRRARRVQVSFASLADLLGQGPFAEIFVALADPSRLVNWLGEPAASSRRQRGGS